MLTSQFWNLSPPALHTVGGETDRERDRQTDRGSSGGFWIGTELEGGSLGEVRWNCVGGGQILKLKPASQKLYYTGTYIGKCNQYLYNRHIYFPNEFSALLEQDGAWQTVYEREYKTYLEILIGIWLLSFRTWNTNSKWPDGNNYF
jgi:hypothetical protein